MKLLFQTDPCSNMRCNTRGSDNCDKISGQCKCGKYSACSESTPFCANPYTESATCIAEVLVTLHTEENLACSCSADKNEPCEPDKTDCIVSFHFIQTEELLCSISTKIYAGFLSDGKLSFLPTL